VLTSAARAAGISQRSLERARAKLREDDRGQPGILGKRTVGSGRTRKVYFFLRNMLPDDPDAWPR
jgi:hypothetical protein